MFLKSAAKINIILIKKKLKKNIFFKKFNILLWFVKQTILKVAPGTYLGVLLWTSKKWICLLDGIARISIHKIYCQ